MTSCMAEYNFMKRQTNFNGNIYYRLNFMSTGNLHIIIHPCKRDYEETRTGKQLYIQRLRVKGQLILLNQIAKEVTMTITTPIVIPKAIAFPTAVSRKNH